MSARRAAISKARDKAEARRLNPLEEFVWQGRDKRGKEMKGEQLARTANLLRAELRKQGINPTVVKPKSKPFFGGAAKKVSARRYRRVQPPAGDHDEIRRPDRELTGNHRWWQQEPDHEKNGQQSA